MNANEMTLLYNYHYWGVRRILKGCAGISQEQYARTTEFGNVRTTLIHTLDAETAWRTICQEHFAAAGSTPGEARPQAEHRDLTEADLPTVADLKARWDAEEQVMRAYLGGLSDQDMLGLVRYVTLSGVLRERLLWHCLLHVVNHATQHRSEAAALLTGYGHSPGHFDFTLFLNEHFGLPD